MSAPRAMAADHWGRGRLAVLDVETTGLNAREGDRIIELAVVQFDNGEVSDEWGVLIDPGVPLPVETVKITGIRQEDVDGQPRFDEIADTFLQKVADRTLVAYNAPFDREFVLVELDRAGRTLPGAAWLDPLVMAKALQPGQKGYKLGTVAERLGVPLVDAHRATADARAAGLVLMAFAPEMPASLGDMLVRQEQWQADQEAKRNMWRGRRGGATQLIADRTGPRNALGPAYAHGNELDPVRYMFLRAAGRA